MQSEQPFAPQILLSGPLFQFTLFGLVTRPTLLPRVARVCVAGGQLVFTTCDHKRVTDELHQAVTEPNCELSSKRSECSTLLLSSAFHQIPVGSCQSLELGSIRSFVKHHFEGERVRELVSRCGCVAFWVCLAGTRCVGRWGSRGFSTSRELRSAGFYSDLYLFIHAWYMPCN